MSRARKSHDGIQPYKIQDRKNARRKKEKNGGQGHSQDFFKGVEGGSHCSKQRVLTIFLLPEYLSCLFEKRLKKGV